MLKRSSFDSRGYKKKKQLAIRPPPRKKLADPCQERPPQRKITRVIRHMKSIPGPQAVTAKKPPRQSCAKCRFRKRKMREIRDKNCHLASELEKAKEKIAQMEAAAGRQEAVQSLFLPRILTWLQANSDGMSTIFRNLHRSMYMLQDILTPEADLTLSTSLLEEDAAEDPPRRSLHPPGSHAYDQVKRFSTVREEEEEEADAVATEEQKGSGDCGKEVNKQIGDGRRFAKVTVRKKKRPSLSEVTDYEDTATADAQVTLHGEGRSTASTDERESQTSPEEGTADGGAVVVPGSTASVGSTTRRILPPRRCREVQALVLEPRPTMPTEASGVESISTQAANTADTGGGTVAVEKPNPAAEAKNRLRKSRAMCRRLQHKQRKPSGTTTSPNIRVNMTKDTLATMPELTELPIGMTSHSSAPAISGRSKKQRSRKAKKSSRADTSPTTKRRENNEDPQHGSHSLPSSGESTSEGIPTEPINAVATPRPPLPSNTDPAGDEEVRGLRTGTGTSAECRQTTTSSTPPRRPASCDSAADTSRPCYGEYALALCPNDSLDNCSK